MRFGSLSFGQKRASPLVLAMLGAIVAIAVWVQTTGNGLDILVLGVAVLITLAFERTAGDWLAELIGAFPAGVVFTMTVIGTAWFVLESEGGRERMEAFFSAAEDRGYRTVIFTRAEPQPDSAPAATVAPAPATPVAPRLSPAQAAGSAAPAAGAVATAGSSDGRTDPSRPPAQTERTGASSAPGTWLLGRPQTPDELLPTKVLVEALPANVPPAARARLRAAVTADGHPVVTGYVAFTVDGVAAGSAVLNPEGIAAISYSTAISGSHEVRAHFRGTSRLAASSAAVTLNVRRPAR